MFTVILLAALSILAIASTVVALYTDGYRRTPTDWSRLPDRVRPRAVPVVLPRRARPRALPLASRTTAH